MAASNKCLLLLSSSLIWIWIAAATKLCPNNTYVTAFNLDNDRVEVSFCGAEDYTATIAESMYSVLDELEMKFPLCGGCLICSFLETSRAITAALLPFDWAPDVLLKRPDHCFVLEGSQYPIVADLSTSSNNSNYTPRNMHESLVAIYQMWAVLDALMQKHDPNVFMNGHIRPVQVRDILQSIDDLNARTYCEIGFNGGHSAAAVLVARPHVDVYSFDILDHEYSLPIANFLSDVYGDRLTFIAGDSKDSVPYISDTLLRGKCDVIFVDGDHSALTVKADIVNMIPAAAEVNVLYIDDTACLDWHCMAASISVGWCLLNDNGAVIEIESPDLPTIYHSESMARYVAEGMYEIGFISKPEFFDYPCGHPCDTAGFDTNWGYAKTSIVFNKAYLPDLNLSKVSLVSDAMPYYLIKKRLFWIPNQLNLDWYQFEREQLQQQIVEDAEE